MTTQEKVPVPQATYDRIHNMAIPGGGPKEVTYYEARYLSCHGHLQDPFTVDAPELPEGINVTMTCHPWEPVSMDEDGGTLWKRKCVVSW